MAVEGHTEIISISKSPYTKGDLIERLNKFRSRYNRYPTRKDFREKRIEPGKNVYYRIFGDMQRAVDVAEEKWIKDRFPPKKRKKYTKRTAREPSGFPCPFCGNHTQNVEEFYSGLAKILIGRLINLLDHKKDLDYFEGVIDSIGTIFKNNNEAIRNSLSEAGLVEICKRLDDVKEENALCEYCGNRIKENEKAHTSSLVTILIIRFIELLTSSSGNECLAYNDGVLDSIKALFGIENDAVRAALHKAGHLDAFEQRHGKGSQGQEYKLQCACCSEWKYEHLITLDNSTLARLICEDCLANSKAGKI